jgi:two-component system, response regulator
MNQAIEILLVEDNESDAKLTLRTLKKNNLCNTIIHLTDGAEALEFIFARGKYSERSVANKPKLILLDLKMPKVSGIEVLQQIKSDERTRTIPVIIMTSSKEDADINTCYSMGVNSYVVKPVGFQNFSKAVVDLGIFWMLVNQEPTI